MENDSGFEMLLFDPNAESELGCDVLLLIQKKPNLYVEHRKMPFSEVLVSMWNTVECRFLRY